MINYHILIRSINHNIDHSIDHNRNHNRNIININQLYKQNKVNNLKYI